MLGNILEELELWESMLDGNLEEKSPYKTVMLMGQVNDVGRTLVLGKNTNCSQKWANILVEVEVESW